MEVKPYVAGILIQFTSSLKTSPAKRTGMYELIIAKSDLLPI